MLKQNFLKEKLMRGKAVVGTWMIIPSAKVSDIIASSGLDFLIIDSEHGPINFETAELMAIACENNSASPVMRVSGVQEGEILKALDIGVHCVQIPNVTTTEQAKQAISFAKYPPVGNRGFSPFTRVGQYTSVHAKELTQRTNENVLVAMHIEGKEAADNIDGILNVKELDIVFIGLYDISKSLGISGDIDNHKVMKILRETSKKINDAGKYPGSIVTSTEQMKRFIDDGIKYITFSVDCEIIKNNYKAITKSFREITS